MATVNGATIANGAIPVDGMTARAGGAAAGAECRGRRRPAAPGMAPGRAWVPSLAAALLASLAALTAAGVPVTEVADLAGDAPPAGWTLSGGAWTSPEYPYPVSSVSLSWSAQGADGCADVSADAGGGAWTPLASLRAAATGATLRLPAEAGFRSFRVAQSDVALSSFSATWTDPRLPAPQGVSAVALSEESVEVSWSPVEGAASYLVTVWTNAVAGASDGQVAWSDGFTNAAAGAASTSAVTTERFNDSYADVAGWECLACVYPSTSAGAVRIGGSDRAKAGSLLTPPLPAGDWHLRLRAWRYGADDGTEMPVMRVSGCETGLVGVLSFSAASTEPEELTLALPALAEGDRLMLRSFTNRTPRVVVDSVSLLSGYSAGMSTPVAVASASVAGAASCTVGGLPRGAVVHVGVAAVGDDGLQGVASDGGADADLSDPPPRAVLNAVPVSSLADLAYAQDFEGLASAGTSWLNGTTLPFWQAFRAEGGTATPVGKLSGSSGAATAGGIYRLSSDAYAHGCAIGACAAKGTGYAWGIAFTNDTAGRVSLTNLSFRAAQWGFGNTVAQGLRLSVLVTNELVDIACAGGWAEMDDLRFDAPFSDGAARDAPEGEELSSAVYGVTMQPGDVLALRWSFERPSGQAGSSAMLGIDDVRAGFSRRERGLVISVASAAD